MIFVLNTGVPGIAPYWELGSATDPLVMALQANGLPVLLAADRKGLVRELPFGWADGRYIGLVGYADHHEWADCTVVMRHFKRIDLEKGLAACPVWHRARYRALVAPPPEVPPKDEP